MAFHPQPLFFLALGLIVGTLAPASGGTSPQLAALVLAMLIGLAAVIRPGSVPLLALIAAAAAAGSTLAAASERAYERSALPKVLADVEGVVILEGLVVRDPGYGDEQLRLEVVASQVVADGRTYAYQGRVRIFVRRSAETPEAQVERVGIGDTIRAWVDLRRPEPLRTPGGFDQRAWAMREGVHAFATCKSERLLTVTKRRPGRKALLDSARERLKGSWRHVPEPLNRAVTASMVLGDEGALDATTREEFRAAGLLHLLVVSGSQVAALIIGLRRALPRSLRINWAGCLLECVVLLAYCELAGALDSILRATVMAMAFAIAVRVDLNRGGGNFLAAAALVLLSLRPLDASDPGAQMSFAATFALVTFARPLSTRLAALRLPGLLTDVLAATLAASLAVAPLSLLHFHRLSLIALPANLLAAPLAVLLLYASLATATLDLVFPEAAAFIGLICDGTAEALRALAHHAAALDPDWRGPAPVLLLLAASLAFVLTGWRRAVLPLSALLAALCLSGRPLGDGRLHAWFLDVGQGDSIVIETPQGLAVVIDAGPAFDRFDAGERVVGEALWALGHRRIEFLAVTHRHADHASGAPFLARHFAPKTIYVNGDSTALRSKMTRTVLQGDAWTVDGVSFRVLAPDASWSLPSRDENARSLVIEVEYGATSLLLMGDASVQTEALIRLSRRGYDVVKAGHHGASNSSSSLLVRETRPQFAVLSVGRRNRFSHPSPLVVERWRKAGALVWRTDLDRTLHISSDGRRIFLP